MTDKKRQSIITVYDPVKEVEKAVNNIKKQQKIINSAMVAVVVVVSLGFVAMIIAVFTIFMDNQYYVSQKHDQYIKIIEEEKNKLSEIKFLVQNLEKKIVEKEIVDTKNKTNNMLINSK